MGGAGGGHWGPFWFVSYWCGLRIYVNAHLQDFTTKLCELNLMLHHY